MSIKFRVLEVKNTLTKKTPKMAYASAVTTGQVPVNDLAQLISERSSVSRADVKAVLDNLSWATSFLLSNSMRVSLGDLGSFHLRLRSKSAETADAFEGRNIKRARIVFHPGKELRIAMANVNFESVNYTTSADAKGAEFGPEEDPNAPTPAVPEVAGDADGGDGVDPSPAPGGDVVRDN